ncbi:MAG: hypothetical protein H7Z14_16065 [Anaerolineae bacterium]|nr:hypothetical protein [Phycisphaerae bacterium]
MAATKIASLSIAGTPGAPLGTLDLTNNDLLLTANATADVTSLVAFARHGGAWDRTGLTSSAASAASVKNTTIGVLSGFEYRSIYGPSAVFNTFAVADTDVLVKYTYYGDTDFNGLVDFDDYSRTDAGFNNNRGGWFNGDVDLNGIVDFDDYSLIDLAFNTQSGTLRRAMAYLDGSDRTDEGMNSPALRLVERHFARFGNAYAANFLNSVPEPAGLGAVGLGMLLLPRRRVRRGIDGLRRLSA